MAGSGAAAIAPWLRLLTFGCYNQQVMGLQYSRKGRRRHAWHTQWALSMMCAAAATFHIFVP